jgi:hypothetical protein
VRGSNFRQICETLKILPFTLNNFDIVHINFFGNMNVLLENANGWDAHALEHFVSDDYVSVTEWRSTSVNMFLVCSSKVVVCGSIYGKWWQDYLAVLTRGSLEAGTTLPCGTSVAINRSAVGWPEAMRGLRQWTHRHTNLHHPAPCLLNPTAAGHDIL